MCRQHYSFNVQAVQTPRDANFIIGVNGADKLQTGDVTETHASAGSISTEQFEMWSLFIQHQRKLHACILLAEHTQCCAKGGYGRRRRSA